jgi:RNA polymerase sigma-70 factor, ECF subfamily
MVLQSSDSAGDFEARLSQCATVPFQAAISILRHREDAEDVAQEAVAKAFQSYSQLREPDRFAGWLAQISRRLAINYQRGCCRRRSREGVGCESVDRKTALDTLLERERAECLRRSIELLPERLRLVTVLSGLYGCPIRDVAAMLEVSEGTVKKLLFVARERIRKHLR